MHYKTSELYVKALICDQSPNNRSFLETHENVTIHKPYFMHDGKKVLVFYDPHHLLKNVRNNLKKGDLMYENETVTWKYIEEFYSMDKTMSVRMAPKLTDKHFELPPFSNMRVNIAA